ncbi:alpha/beta hydrolase [Denitrificimonas caeni]|uniref:alpha/beta hydrolase n=1 Tax=Denitrificimonas caeni TaxID=521720 RepID=UPI001964F3FE|nr:alpha/beta fold hydrolase [Denitrificimonas caeni]
MASIGIIKALRATLTRLLYGLTVLVSGLTLTGCTSLSALFFYPQSVLISTPEEAELEYQDVWLKAEDKTKLHAWWIPAQGDIPDSNVMVLYVHGNAENISSHSRSIYWLPANGVSVLALDYRGFGASEGQARMPGVLQDLEAAALWMKQQYPQKELIILGQSIGAAMAINFTAQAAETYQIQALVLDAPFTGFATAARSAMSKNIVGWLIWPFTVLIPGQWDPIKHIEKIDIPVLIMHSPKDEIVPYKQGKQLYKTWKKAHPQQHLCWLDAKGPHIMSFAFPEIRRAVLTFMNSKRCYQEAPHS